MAIIVHVDLDAFYASVEQRDHPEWRGKPVIVGAAPDERGVVSTCSYEARRFGVRSAMPSRTAFARCPHAIFVSPRMEVYHAVSRQVFETFADFTPFVEPVSVDEAYLDVTGSVHLFGGKRAMAEKLRHEIRSRCGITASVGVATNRLLAKLGSEYAKPDGMKIMPEHPEQIAAMLAPRPLKDIWGVGKKTDAMLAAFGFKTCGDVQRADRRSLERVLGARQAQQLVEYAFGIASDEVQYDDTDSKSISREHTFPDDTSDRQQVRRTLLALAEEVGAQLRDASRYAKVAKVRIRNADFTTFSHQHRFSAPARDDISLREMAIRLLDEMWTPGCPRCVRLIGFGVDNFTDSREAEAPDLFGECNARDELLQKRERLSETLDRLRKRGMSV